MAVPTPESYPATPKPTPPNTPVVQTKQEPARNKFFKPALIALGIVLVIVISEVGYLVFKGYGKTYLQLHTTPTPTPPPTPPTLDDIQASFSRTQVSSDKVRDYADRLDLLSPKLEFIQTASLNYNIAGLLVENAPEIKEKDGIKYTHRMKLKADSGKTITYHFTEQEIQTAIIFLFTSTGSSQVNIRDINRGDFVTIKSIVNLLDPDPNFRIVLEVLRG